MSERSIYRPSDAGFEAEMATDNHSLVHRPSLIISAQSASDVVSAVERAAVREESVGVQATGHGMSVASDGVLVTTRRLAGVQVDVANRLARVGAGARWGDVLAQTVPYGLAPLHGSSAGVGAVGFTLGGGVGPLGRMYGYGADSVRRLQLVTADSLVREVSPSQNPDLFFAVRGAKGNFGIVTEMDVELHPIADFLGGGLFFDGAHAEDVLARYATWVQSNERHTATSVLLVTFPDVEVVPEPLRGRPVAHLRFAHFGDIEEGARRLAPMRSAAPILSDTVQVMPYADIASVHNDPTGPYEVFESGFFAGPLRGGDISTLVAASRDQPMVVEIRHHAGAYADRPSHANPVLGRDAEFTVYLGSAPAEGSARRDREAHAGIRTAFEDNARGTVLNFLGAHADPTWVRDAFEPRTYDELVSLKAALDPTNMFRVNHNLATEGLAGRA